MKLVALAVLALGGCATTVDDQPIADAGQTPISGEVIVDDSTVTVTVPIVGTATALLSEMAVEMSRLGNLIVDKGDARGSLQRIEQLWEAIRPEVKQLQPTLVNSIAATVDLAVTAVERTRPADADKAFRLLTDVVDAYTGDG